MPTAMRCSLIAAALCTSLGAAMAAGELGPGKPSTWSDPPARSTEAVKPPAKPPLPAAASAAQQEARRSGANAKASARNERIAARRAARRRVKAAERPRHERQPIVSRRPVPVASVRPGEPPVFRRTYPAYRAAVVLPDEDDERFDRLRTAVPAGYLILRRRTVEYPDGRTIRIYRPAEDGIVD